MLLNISKIPSLIDSSVIIGVCVAKYHFKYSLPKWQIIKAGAYSSVEIWIKKEPVSLVSCPGLPLLYFGGQS